jgi:hypothetical protein
MCGICQYFFLALLYSFTFSGSRPFKSTPNYCTSWSRACSTGKIEEAECSNMWTIDDDFQGFTIHSLIILNDFFSLLIL